MKIFICILAFVGATMALDAALTGGMRQFTAKMLNEVYKMNNGSNIVISAFSVMPPLAQLALASVGDSHDEILRAIGMPNDATTTKSFSELTRSFKSIPGVEFNLANRIYIPEDAELNDQFAATSRDIFNSDVKNINFGKTVEAAKEINAWVEDNTNKRIKDLVRPEDFDSSTAAVLVNAIYFKGKWKKPFESYNTYDRDFHVSKDRVIKVPTMEQTGDFQYGESKELDAKLLILPYDGDSASMLIVLPNEIDGIHSLMNKITQDADLLPKAVSEQMSSNEVNVQLPKFKIETTTKLSDVLIKMNIVKLFSPTEARLNNLLKGGKDLSVSSAIQKAFIEVNEEGAEAAAANAFDVVDRMEEEEAFWRPPILFIVDRPFYFEIRLKDLPEFEGIIDHPDFE